MTIAITTLGLKKKVVFGDDSDDLYPDGSDIDLVYSSSNNTISLRIKDALRFTQYSAIPIADVTIGGVVITDQSVFDTQLAAVFPNEGGGSDTPTLDEVLAVVPATLTENRLIELNGKDLEIVDTATNKGMAISGEEGSMSLSVTNLFINGETGATGSASSTDILTITNGIITAITPA